MGDTETAYKRSNKRTLGFCLLVGSLAFLYGMVIGQTSGFIAIPRYNFDFGVYNEAAGTNVLSAPQISGLSGTTLASAAVSAGFAGTIGTRWGRKIGLVVAAVSYITGVLIQVVATSYATLIVGKVANGFGIGFAANFVIPYWAETAPVSRRGSIIVMYQALINLAQFVGQCTVRGSSELTTRWAYRGPLMTEFLPPLILLCGIYWVPESPRWYASRGKTENAYESMRRLRGPTYPVAEVDAEVDEIIAMLEVEKELEGAARWSDCFKGTDLRRTLLSIFTLLCQEFSGIAFVSGYGTYFFTLSGVTDPFTITVISGMCGLAGSLTSFSLIRYVGRRYILIGGTIVQTISMFTFAIVGVAAPGSGPASRCIAAFVCIFIFSYGATWGPLSFVLLGELPSTKLRSKTVALSTSVGWSFNLLILVGMPYLLNPSYVMLGPRVGFIFGATQILSLIFGVFFLPETKDRSLEEIDEMFMNKVSAWGFRKYKSTKTVQGISVATGILSDKQQQMIVQVENAS